MMPSASIAVIAWSPATIFDVVVVGNVSGTQKLNRMISAAHT